MCVFHNTTWHCWCSLQPSGLRALLFINTGCSVQAVAFLKPVAPLASILNSTSYVLNFYMDEGQKTFFEKIFLFKREEKKKPKAKQTKKRKVFGLNKHYKTTNREKRLLMLYIKKFTTGNCVTLLRKQKPFTQVYFHRLSVQNLHKLELFPITYWLLTWW